MSHAQISTSSLVMPTACPMSKTRNTMNILSFFAHLVCARYELNRVPSSYSLLVDLNFPRFLQAIDIRVIALKESMMASLLLICPPSCS